MKKLFNKKAFALLLCLVLALTALLTVTAFAEGKIRTTMMLGLVFLETAIIYALLVVILIIFVL